MVRTIDTLVGKMSMLRVASEISIYVTLWSTVTGVQGSDLCSVWLVQPASVRPSGRHPHPAMHASPALSTTPPTNQPTNQPNQRGGPAARARRHVSLAAVRPPVGGGVVWGVGTSREPRAASTALGRWLAVAVDRRRPQVSTSMHGEPHRCAVCTYACMRSIAAWHTPAATYVRSRPSKLGSQIRWEQPQSMKKKTLKTNCITNEPYVFLGIALA